MLDISGLTPDALMRLPPQEFAELERLIDKQTREAAERKFYTLYPDRGPLRRELYPKHLDFFRAGREFQERAFIAANRSGKSFCVCYEVVCHLTGEYPEWWEGRRFDRPITTWVAGEDTKAVRESLQPTLLGITGAHGTGLIPGKLLINTTARSGVPEAVDAFTVRHVSGGVSRGVFKTYDQGRESFQASKVDVVVFDEEPPIAIYTEGLTRTMSTVPGEESGIVMCAFTPLKGLSGMVLSFMPGGERKEGAL
jgi:phage terminase large subunit-like protein